VVLVALRTAGCFFLGGVSQFKYQNVKCSKAMTVEGSPIHDLENEEFLNFDM
jgi:hypothetical protein